MMCCVTKPMCCMKTPLMMTFRWVAVGWRGGRQALSRG